MGLRRDAMNRTGIAIYEDGVLRLLTPLGLPEHTRVRVHVEPVDPKSASPAEDEPLSTEAGSGADSLLDLIGAYHSSAPLIDGIPVSEDPDLYLVAEMLGERAAGLHAWEIAPARYVQGQNGQPVRRDAPEKAK
jgi:hypothetical protein